MIVSYQNTFASDVDIKEERDLEPSESEFDSNSDPLQNILSENDLVDTEANSGITSDFDVESDKGDEGGKIDCTAQCANMVKHYCITSKDIKLTSNIYFRF